MDLVFSRETVNLIWVYLPGICTSVSSRARRMKYLNIIFFLMKSTCCMLSINVVPLFVIAVSQVNRILCLGSERIVLGLICEKFCRNLSFHLYTAYTNKQNYFGQSLYKSRSSAA